MLGRAALLALVLLPASGAAAPASAVEPAVLQGFGAQDRSVILKLSKPAGFRVTVADSPPSLVVILYGTTPSDAVLTGSFATRMVTGAKVTALESGDSPTTKVVLTLDAPRDYAASWSVSDLVLELRSRVSTIPPATSPGTAPAKTAAGTKLGYPGSTWGELSRDLDGLEGNATMGSVRQGIDWVKLPGGFVLNTFGVYRWRMRSELRPFFNAHGPGAGFNVSRGPLELGMDFSWIRYPELHRDTRDFAVYGIWFKKWDLGPRLGSPSMVLGLPLSTWGRMDYDVEKVEGGGSQGWVRQGIDWFKVFGATFDTFGEYRWRLRSENKRFYNVHGPAVGARLQRAPFDLALSYAWRTYPQLQRITRNLELSLSWFFGWDLKPR